MTRFNKRYKGKARTTDVLAFEPGDVLISMDAARRQARDRRHSVPRELCHLAVHGLLHLAGYRDASPRLRRLMDAETVRLLEEANAET
jgi:probable rRNA maturation factor